MDRCPKDKDVIKADQEWKEWDTSKISSVMLNYKVGNYLVGTISGGT